ncbi:MAG: alpha,6-mannosyltransferase [Patescibacteria group bacterium]|nr:alpha,6-mannosyltransferase [Patescibacteria group bacterium]
MRNTNIVWLLVVFGLLLVVYSVFSYSFTDPNLVLTGWQPYWQFQLWMWKNIFSNKVLVMSTFSFLVTGFFVCYLLLIKELKKLDFLKVEKKHILIYGVLIACLTFSYNALSHDVFNYIFNAKMVNVYQENPHVKTALEYPQDEWTRFMHNTHTPAPYGYGWTVLSIIPLVIGSQIFSATWLLFRVIEIVSIGLLYITLQRTAKVLLKRELKLHELAILFLNPLFLIEVVSNMHNDLWMMIPGIAAVAVTAKYSSNIIRTVVVAGLLLAASISIKFATVVLLLPMILVLAQRTLLEKMISQYVKRFPFSPKITHWLTNLIERWTVQYLPLVSSVLLFLPLLTSRSQQFHPWYLLWSMSWLPLIKQQYWKTIMIVFSFSSLLRYLPWMYLDGFAKNTLLWQQLISWGVPLAFLMIWIIRQNIQTQKTLRNTV